MFIIEAHILRSPLVDAEMLVVTKSPARTKRIKRTFVFIISIVCFSDAKILRFIYNKSHNSYQKTRKNVTILIIWALQMSVSYENLLVTLRISF